MDRGCSGEPRKWAQFSLWSLQIQTFGNWHQVKPDKQSFKWQMVRRETTAAGCKCPPFWVVVICSDGCGGESTACNIAENTLIQSRQLLKVTTFDGIRNNCKREKKAERKLLNSSAHCCQLKRPQLMRNNYAALPSDFSAFMINAGLLTSHEPQQ